MTFRCKSCKKVIVKENIFAHLPLIGNWCAMFPVYFCGAGKEERLIITRTTPAWCLEGEKESDDDST